jgi:hypothetical protein
MIASLLSPSHLEPLSLDLTMCRRLHTTCTLTSHYTGVTLTLTVKLKIRLLGDSEVYLRRGLGEFMEEASFMRVAVCGVHIMRPVSPNPHYSV